MWRAQLASEDCIRSHEILGAGLLAGAILAACAVAFAVLGLTPSLSWIPEVPLLIVAGAVPIVVLIYTGYRTAKSSETIVAGLLAGALAGSIGGLGGGVSYAAYGKSVLNIPIGIVLGAVAGALLGGGGAFMARRTGAPRVP